MVRAASHRLATQRAKTSGAADMEGAGETAVPYYRDPATGQTYPLTSQLANRLQPPTNWVPIGIAAGGVLLVLFMLSGRKS